MLLEIVRLRAELGVFVDYLFLYRSRNGVKDALSLLTRQTKEVTQPSNALTFRATKANLHRSVVSKKTNGGK